MHRTISTTSCCRGMQPTSRWTKNSNKIKKHCVESCSIIESHWIQSRTRCNCLWFVSRSSRKAERQYFATTTKRSPCRVYTQSDSKFFFVSKKIMKQNEKECTRKEWVEEWEGSIATNWISRKTKSNKSEDLIYTFMHTLTSLQAELMCILCLSLSHCHSSCTFCEDVSLSFGFETFICVKSFCYTFFVYLCLRTHTHTHSLTLHIHSSRAVCVFIAI